MIIEVVGRDSFNDPDLISELHQILAMSVESPCVLLKRTLEKCSVLYLGKESSGRIVSFFFADLGSHITLNGRAVRTLYLGLSATVHDKKMAGVVLPLYSLCIADAAEWERMTGEKLLIWGATSNTFVLRVVQKYFAAVVPSSDGHFPPWAEPLALGLRKHLNMPIAPEGHPFVLRNAFPGYRYTAAEARRIERLNRTETFVLVQQLDVRNCESVLFLCQIGKSLLPFHTRAQVVLPRSGTGSVFLNHGVSVTSLI
jgi:hypothetical protein